MSNTPLRTREEAIKYLRLDVGSRNPERAIEYYRRTGRLKGIRIGHCVMFLQSDLDEFIRIQQEEVPV